MWALLARLAPLGPVLVRLASLAVELAGFAAVVYAAFLVHEAAAWALGGLVLLNYAYGWSR